MNRRHPSSRRAVAQAPAAEAPLIVTHDNVAEWARLYADGELDPGQMKEVNKQLAANPRLLEAFEKRREVLTMVNSTVGQMQISNDFGRNTNQRLARRQDVKVQRETMGLETTGQKLSAVGLGIDESVLEGEDKLLEAAPAGGLLDSLQASFGGAPWWIISGAFHGLLLLLLTLIGLAVMQAEVEDTIIVTNLEQVKEQEYDEKIERDIFKKPVPMPESDVQVETPIVTHEEVEVADHVETENDMDMETAQGDENAISDVPLGGVGTVAALGLGGGGGGAFGQRGGGGRRRLAMRGGGGKATESAVDAALAWLARHQEADGHWDTVKYEGGKNVDPGVTGLALLAFLGAGHTEKVGKYKDNVKRAVDWIISQQEADGSIGKNYKEHWHPGYAYHHAICGLGLAEAAGMGRVQRTVEAAQKAVTYTTDIHQQGDGSEKGAWRYNAKQHPDSSVSGWFVMQLKSAKIAGLAVDPASFEGAMKFYDSIEVKDADNEGYGGGKFPYQKGKPVTLNNTSIGILCNLFLGRKPGELMGGAHYLHQNLPTWNKSLGAGLNGNRTFPMYYTYYSTLTMFQMGGDLWKDWNVAMKQMLLPNQIKGGDNDGSWDKIGGGDDQMGGRVYMTAMGALCLEVYYRYLPITRK